MSSAPCAPFEPDDHTVVLYHFDEGKGNQTTDVCGDTQLTLRAHRHAQWGSHPGFGACARFDRRTDDANLLVGPANNDKLHLRPCTAEWTVEAWVRYTGTGGLEQGHTYVNICGTEDEGLGLPIGMRGGWNSPFTALLAPAHCRTGSTPPPASWAPPAVAIPITTPAVSFSKTPKPGAGPAPTHPGSKTTTGTMSPGSFGTSTKRTSSFWMAGSSAASSCRFPTTCRTGCQRCRKRRRPLCSRRFYPLTGPAKAPGVRQFRRRNRRDPHLQHHAISGCGSAVNRSTRTAHGYLQFPLLGAILDRRSRWPPSTGSRPKDACPQG